MCAGAIVWSGISTVIYGTNISSPFFSPLMYFPGTGTPAEELGSMAGGTFVVPCRHVFSFCKVRTYCCESQKLMSIILTFRGLSLSSGRCYKKKLA